MFAALYSPDVGAAPALVASAQEFSPRFEAQLGGRLALIDIAGLGRIVGDAHAVAGELRESALRRTSHVTVALAPSRTAALLLAVAGRDAVVPPGRTAATVGALSLSVFDTLASLNSRNPRNLRNPRNPRNPRNLSCPLCSLAQAPRLCAHPGGACTELVTLGRWGLSTLGDLAALPSADLSARLGQMGVVLQRLARGMDLQPLVPIVEEARFEASLDLEWPIDDLQPLSFVLARLLDPLSAALERADRGAAAMTTELTLVRARRDAPRAHIRRLELPAPMRDARVLRTLILLDLESHPPQAGVDRVAIRIEPTPGRIVQFSLLEHAGPKPETLITLVSRLTALMGEGRVGSPLLLDSHAPDAFALQPFNGQQPAASSQREVEPIGGTDQRNQSAEPTGGTNRRNQSAEPSGGTNWRNQSAEPISGTNRRNQSAEPSGGTKRRNPAVEPTGGTARRNQPVEPTGGTCLRRFRLPVIARVVMADDRPARVTTERIGIKGGDVWQCAGPWRSSGHWWASPDVAPGTWDRDEYDVALADGAAYRIYRDRHDDRWFVEGILD
jgi:hypothetical protein